MIIGIDGHGGSGKSTFAQKLADKLRAEIIHIDDFASFNNLFDWWPRLVHDVLDPISRGAEELSYERSKWWDTHEPEPMHGQPVTNIMIIEGVGALRKELQPYVQLGIFVDTAKEVCLERGFTRDKGMDGKSDDEIRSMWQKWREGEEEFYRENNPKLSAHIIIEGVGQIETQAERAIALVAGCL